MVHASAQCSAGSTHPARVRGWLKRDPRHEEEFRNLEAIWGSTAFLKAVKALPVDPALRHRGRDGGGDAARRCLPPACFAAGWWQYPRLMIAWEADYTTATGAQSMIPLPDGSTMVLNTASAVSLDFENGRRRVRLLRGEAFFDVRHDPAHPFTVAAQFGRSRSRGQPSPFGQTRQTTTCFSSAERFWSIVFATAAIRLSSAPERASASTPRPFPG